MGWLRFKIGYGSSLKVKILSITQYNRKLEVVSKLLNQVKVIAWAKCSAIIRDELSSILSLSIIS